MIPCYSKGTRSNIRSLVYRLSCGVPGRLPRVVPDVGAEFNGYHVPPGVCNKHGTIIVNFANIFLDCC